MFDVAIIGGGASGLIAAGEIAALGKSVVLIEKTDRVGKKLLATGNGRCNLANEDFSPEHYHGSAGELADHVFEEFSPQEIEAYWHSIGIDLVTLERGKQYPRSLQASSVLNALRRKMEQNQVQTLVNAQVMKIRPCQGGYLLHTTIREEGKEGKDKKQKPVFIEKKIKAEKVIVCAGGKASPSFGANGEGAALLKDLGLAILPMRPSICRLLCDSAYCRRLFGVRLTIPVTLKVDGECIRTVENEVLFTEEGLSGPAILDLSRAAGDALTESRFVQISMDLASEKSEGEWFRFFMERFRTLRGWNAEEALEGWLTKKLINPVLNEAGIDRTTDAGDLSKKEIASLIGVLKQFTMNVKGLDGFKEAQVTVGGLRGDQLTQDLEIRNYPGLYACGEVIDLDGDCGGYNLMWAAASALKVVQAVVR